MPNQTRWPPERRLKYAELIRHSHPWDTGYIRTKENTSALKWNKLQTGAQSAPVLAIKRLLYQTNNLLKEVRLSSEKFQKL